MILQVEENSSILKNSKPINIGSFSIITGENGSGKSQLLNQISQVHNWQGMSYLRSDDDNPLNEIFLSEPLNIISEPNGYSFINDVQELWKEYEKIITFYSLIRDYPFTDIKSDVAELNAVIKRTTGVMITIKLEDISLVKVAEHQVQKLRELAAMIDKHPAEIRFEDFVIFTPISPNLFSPSLSVLFHQHALKMKHYAWMFVDPKSPWEVFNEMLAYTKFKYRCVFTQSNRADIVNEVLLKDEGSGKEVPLRSLSSGEQTIMSLIFALFHSSRQGRFPQVILFDEPDAYLHPSLAKTFLDILTNVFVTENKVNVIITTHSPSTVALYTGSDLFVMDRDKGYPVKVDKPTAIRSLMSGLTNLNLLYKNIKQVFVEADFDKKIYETILPLLSYKLIPDIHLTFISVGNDTGGCDRVKRYAQEFLRSGNTYACGIIDWELKNKSRDNVCVLGEDARYNIENYIFDPLLVSIFLLRERLGDEVQLGYDPTDSYLKVVSFSNEKLQLLVNKITSLVKPEFEKSLASVDCKLVNGFSIKIPKWYLEMPGHELETKITARFHQLRKFNTKKLKYEILEKVMIECPHFLSEDFLIMFSKLQRMKI